MRQLEAQTLERFNNTEIDVPVNFDVRIGNRQLDYSSLIGNTPIVTTSYDAYHDPQLTLGTDIGLPFWDEEKLYPVGRLNGIHGRNIEVLADNVLVEDQYGNTFYSLCIKGTDFSDPHFFKTRTAAREYIIYGLQESIVMERIIRASKILRANGVGTEYICGLTLPENFPLDKDDVGIDGKPPIELPGLLEHLANKFATGQQVVELADTIQIGRPDSKSALEIKLDMIERFKDCDYLISYRAMDCPYRAGELSNEEKFGDFKQFIASRPKLAEISEFLDGLDVAQYTRSLFVHNLAENVANMHKSGLHHGFLVVNNLTALGSIVDLDSCRGEPLDLGDDPITEKDQIDDITECLRTIHHIVEGVDFHEGSRIANYLRRQSEEHWAAQYFLEAYLSERFNTNNERVTFLASLLRFANQTKDKDAELEEGLHVFSVAQQVIDVYNNKIARDKIPDIAPQIELINPNLSRSSSFVRTLPSKFFRDARDKILDEGWSMNEEIKSQFRTKRHVYNPTQLTVRSLVLEQIFDDQLRTEKARLSAANLLFLVGCSFDRYKPRREDRKQLVEVAKNYLQEQTGAVLDVLSTPVPSAAGLVLKPYIDHSLKEFEDRLGSIDIGIPDTSILYLENDEQYDKVFKTFGIGHGTEIKGISRDFLDSLINDRAKLGDDSVIIADYKITKWIAEATNRKSAAAVLLRPRPNAKPLLIVQGLLDWNINVSVQPSPFIDERKAYYAYDELLDAVAPSVPHHNPRLFSMDVTYKLI